MRYILHIYEEDGVFIFGAIEKDEGKKEGEIKGVGRDEMSWMEVEMQKMKRKSVKCVPKGLLVNGELSLRFKS